MGIRFMWNNLWDGAAVLTASSENPNFPALNTQHRFPTKVWRSTSVAGAEWLKVDLGEAKPVSVFIIRLHNFTTGATVQLEGNSSDDWTAPAYTTTIPINDKIMVHFLSSELSLQFWRVVISDTANSDGYLEIGRIFLGTYFEPSRNFLYGSGPLFRDDSILSYSEGGQYTAIKKNIYRVFPFEFSLLTSNDIASFKTIFKAKGVTGDFFICQDPEDPLNTTWQVHFTKPLNPLWQFKNYYSISIEVEEVR